MAAQFCDNDDCPDSWHWTELHCTDVGATPESCRDTSEEEHREGLVGSFFAA
ncbi:hypothetical protein J3A64_003178 [Pseudarthrobacter sp. PvP004]|jgi:hypothetical protein|nr:hypothetical protein [Pseudarthrobacter sp. PvP004]